MGMLMDLIDTELSEPYSIFTYRYFINSWPQVRPKPYTMRSKPYTLRHKPYTLRPKPNTLRPKPYTLRLKPYTLRPKPYTLTYLNPNSETAKLVL